MASVVVKSVICVVERLVAMTVAKLLVNVVLMVIGEMELLFGFGKPREPSTAICL